MTGSELLTQPRMQHYLFAHRALPEFFFRRPLETLAILAGEKGHHFLSDLWSVIGRELDEDEQVQVEEMLVEPLLLSDEVHGVVIRLPQPRAITEAHLVAPLVRVQEGRGWFHQGPEVAPRFFTLELGLEMSGSLRTVLCEWTAEGTHLNMGDGPEAVEEEFIASLAARMLD